jgi:signal transduction histidine kinase
MKKGRFVLGYPFSSFTITEPASEHQTARDPARLARVRSSFWHPHLSDVRLLINRTLVYVALTAIVVGIYVIVVGYLGLWFEEETGNLAISLFATGLIALLFQPLRTYLQRGVNRLMYGERDDPYAVLSRLGQRLEAALAPEAVLPSVVETAAQALKLPYVAIALKQDEEMVVTAAYGSVVDEPVTLPLVYQGETIGQLLLAPRRPGESLTAADWRLLQSIAQHAGVAAHAVRLTADLQRSRERLVMAREEERRRLQRDLHDGLGPVLASLPLKLDAALNLLRRNPAEASTLLLELKIQTQATIIDIRRLVYDLRPPVLDQLGLVVAIRQHATAFHEANGLQISLETPESLPPLSAAVEVAAYRIVQEALTNVAAHASAQTCLIRLRLNHGLYLEIKDDGVGLPQEGRMGVGLASMRERAAELGGSCIIEPGPSGGTQVMARLPLKNSSVPLFAGVPQNSTPERGSSDGTYSYPHC